MVSERIRKQLDFLCEAEKLKSILRRSRVRDCSRRENSAEHSWQLALMVSVLAEHAPWPIDLARAMKMAVVHDLVEIDAGDTFCYDDLGHQDKLARESRAAKRLFGMLPKDQAEEISALWLEFERGQTPEARFVRALDRLHPMLLHGLTEGAVWREHQIRRSQVEARAEEIRLSAQDLWPIVQGLLDKAVAAGWLREN